MADGKVRIQVDSNAISASRDFNKLDRSIDSATGEMRQFDNATKGANESLSTLKRVGVGALAFLGARELKDATFSLVQFASDAEETENKFRTAFRGITQEAEATALSIANSYNIAEQESKALLASTGDILKGFGFTADEALSLSSDIQRLSADLVSYNNFAGGTAQASEIVTKALLGERDALISLGTKINESDLQDLAKQQGLVFKELTRSEKAYLTFNAILKQNGDAIGDVQRSQESYVNQTRRLEAVLTDLKTSLGNELLPAFTSATKEAVVFVQNGIQPITKAFGVLIRTIALIKDSLDLVATAFQNVGLGFAGVISAFKNAVQGDFQQAKESLKTAVEDIKLISTEAFDEIEQSYENLFNQTSTNKLIGNAQNASSAIQQSFDNIKTDVAPTVELPKLQEKVIPSGTGKKEAEQFAQEFDESILVSLEDIGSAVSSSLSTALTTPFQEGESAAQRFGQVAISIIQQIAQQALTKQIAGLFSTAGTGGAGGGASAPVASAKGNIFNDGGLQKFAKGGAFTNSVVSRPTLFPMSGGQTGLMGEAGAEAIVPLTRTKNGDLGISAEGVSQSVVNVYNQAGVDIQTVERPNNETDIFIRRVNGALSSDRTLNSFQAQLEKTNKAGAQAI